MADNTQSGGVVAQPPSVQEITAGAAPPPSVVSSDASISGVRYLGYPAGWIPAAGENAPLYKEGDAQTFFEGLSAGEILLLKRKMYAAGLYKDVDANSPILQFSQITDADRIAAETLLTETNLNVGRVAGWQDVLKARAAQMAQISGTETDNTINDLVDGKISFSEQLRSFVAQNGLRISNSTLDSIYNRVVGGETTLEQEQQRLREKYLVGMYPAWKDEILQGQNIADIASPYVETMASMLDIPSSSVELTDPLLKRALQGVGENGKPGIVPLWQFEYEVRKDKRWQESPEGLESVAGALNGAYQEMMGMFNA